VTAEEYQARVDEIEATYRERLKAWDLYCSMVARGGPSNAMPFGPAGAKRERDDALRQAREDRISQLELDRLEGGLAPPETKELVALAGADDRDHPKRSQQKGQGDETGPSRIPEKLVELALQLHERDGLGRRRLADQIPGVTEYQASQVLGWHRVGKPAGLWLEDGRLKCGRAISTTPDGLRLPRL
jgi:hypothetical protein